MWSVAITDTRYPRTDDSVPGGIYPGWPQVSTPTQEPTPLGLPAGVLGVVVVPEQRQRPLVDALQIPRGVDLCGGLPVHQCQAGGGASSAGDTENNKRNKQRIEGGRGGGEQPPPPDN